MDQLAEKTSSLPVRVQLIWMLIVSYINLRNLQARKSQKKCLYNKKSELCTGHSSHCAKSRACGIWGHSSLASVYHLTRACMQVEEILIGKQSKRVSWMICSTDGSSIVIL